MQAGGGTVYYFFPVTHINIFCVEWAGACKPVVWLNMLTSLLVAWNSSLFVVVASSSDNGWKLRGNDPGLVLRLWSRTVANSQLRRYSEALIKVYQTRNVFASQTCSSSEKLSTKRDVNLARLVGPEWTVTKSSLFGSWMTFF